MQTSGGFSHFWCIFMLCVGGDLHRVGVTVDKTDNFVNERLATFLARRKRQIIPLKQPVFQRNALKCLIRTLSRYSMIVGLTNTPVDEQ